MRLHDFQDMAGGHLDGVPGWVISVVGLGVAAPGLATPMEDGLTFHSVVHGIGVIVGTLAVLWPLMRGLIKKSDEKTSRVVKEGVSEIGKHAAEALRRELELIKSELSAKDKLTQGVGPQLLAINTKLADLGDIREELHATAFTIGQQDSRIIKLEKDVNVLHAWRRDQEEWTKTASALLEKWKQRMRAELEARALAAGPTLDLEAPTPPLGTPAVYIGPTGGKKP